MRGRTRSSAYLVSPVTFAHASIFGSGCPMTVKFFDGGKASFDASPGTAPARDRSAVRLRRRALDSGCVMASPQGGCGTVAHPKGRELDRIQDLRIPGAAAEIPGERLANVLA